MDKADNPYNNFLEAMQTMGARDAPYFIGTILSASPLKIQVGELEIGRKQCKINRFLLAGYTRRWSLAETTATGQTAAKGQGGSSYEAFSSHSHAQSTIGIPDGAYTTLDDFVVGEEVLLLRSADGQQYILLCKLA